MDWLSQPCSTCRSTGIQYLAVSHGIQHIYHTLAPYTGRYAISIWKVDLSSTIYKQTKPKSKQSKDDSPLTSATCCYLLTRDHGPAFSIQWCPFMACTCIEHLENNDTHMSDDNPSTDHACNYLGRLYNFYIKCCLSSRFILTIDIISNSLCLALLLFVI